VAILVECILCGTIDPAKLCREKVRRAIAQNDPLRQRIERAKKEPSTVDGGRLITWDPDGARVKNVVTKLARCHAAYELNEPQLAKPNHVVVMPLVSMSDSQRDQFEGSPFAGTLRARPEVGSRAMQRLIIADEAYGEGWVTVQEGRYRYMADGRGGVVVRGVMSEYLAYEAIWD
jgi:hypothetical protein